jgi:phosphopantetheinyl transferase
MPLILKEHKEEDFVVGIWKIEESLDWFESKYQLSAEEKVKYSKFMVDSRKKQWLSSRLLVNELSPGCGPILYDKDGKPYFQDKESNLSVSHSYDYASAIISPKKKVGIDIEKASDRLHRVKERFLSHDELVNIDTDNELKALCAHWCAKEALYKVYGLRNLDFKEQIYVDAFKMKEDGNLSGRIIVNDDARNYNLKYRQIDDYIMVYLVD